MEYQLNLLHENRQYESTLLNNFGCHVGTNSFIYGEKNIILGPNGSGKSTLIRALYITAGVSSINWNDLNWFADNKWIEIMGQCTTGVSKRKRKYRDTPRNYYGLDNKNLSEVSLIKLKRNIGMYENQRLLFYVINKKFINEYNPRQRALAIKKKLPFINTNNWIKRTNEFLSTSKHNFKVVLESEKLSIIKHEKESLPYSSGQLAIIIVSMVLAAAEQKDNPAIILDEDNVPTYSLDSINGKNFIDTILLYKGQVFMEQCYEGTLVKYARERGFHFIDLKIHEGNIQSVSKRIATREYVADTDLSFKSKIKLSEEMIMDALSGKKKPVIAWSGGVDSTLVLYLVRRRIPDIPVVRVLTGNTDPQLEKFCKEVEKDWKLNTSIRDSRDNLISTKVRPEYNIWSIIDNYGFPILPKYTRASTAPYYNAVKEHCRVCTNTCCYLLKIKPAKLLYRNCGIDLVYRGLTGEESQNRKMAIALGGYIKHVALYGTTMADIIGHFSKTEVMFAHKYYNIPWADAYNRGHVRTGCINCCTSILYPDNNIMKLQKENKKYWDFLMKNKGLGRELMKLKYIINKSNRLGLVKGQQLQLDEFDISYLNNIDSYDIGDISAILDLRPCSIDCSKE